MLFEIVCEEFKKKRIVFNTGLNTILGDDIGTNSIGKSSFLMIIDFVFGGNDYLLKSTDIQRNIGQHVVKFAFKFDNEFFYFSRDTDQTQNVSVCDQKYKIISEMSLSKYNEFLFGKYNIDLPEITFRDIIGRYSRIYGKENLNEKRPLDVVRKEASGKSINSLLKLFNLFSAISELEMLLKEKEDILTTFTKATKYQFIKSINKTQYTHNIKELDRLKIDKIKFADDLDHNLIDISSLEAEEALNLKNKISILKRNKSRYNSNIEVLNNNLTSTTAIKEENLKEIAEFFPDVNFRKINEIESFHKEITSVLKRELQNKKKEVEQLIKITESEISNNETKYKELIDIPNLSKSILNKYSEIQRSIEDVEKENALYETSLDLKKAKEEAKLRRDKMKNEQLVLLQNKINSRMEEINDFIYSRQKKPPILNINNNQYTFETVDDTGTGISYKSMVVFDISILEMTPLPILIHDSVVLKQISDQAIEKILEKYVSHNKQIFISLDKLSSYGIKTNEILNKTKILELSPGGNELFGRSWSNK